MRNHVGFTLIELMITIAIAALLLGVAVPSMASMMESNRRAAAVNSLISDMQLARSAAASRGAEVVVCHSTNGTSCSGQSNPDWSTGWLVFVDNVAANGSVDTDEEVLAVAGARSGVTMPSTASSGRFQFKPGARSMVGATVAVCPKGSDKGRWIIVSATGRPRLQDTQFGSLSCP